MEEKNYDLVTEARDGYPKIFWDKNSEGIKYDYEMAYEVIGWSEDGRTFKGGCSWSYGEVTQDPFAGEIVEVCSKCLKEKPANEFTKCTDCLDLLTDNDGRGNF